MDRHEQLRGLERLTYMDGETAHSHLGDNIAPPCIACESSLQCERCAYGMILDRLALYETLVPSLLSDLDAAIRERDAARQEALQTRRPAVTQQSDYGVATTTPPKLPGILTNPNVTPSTGYEEVTGDYKARQKEAEWRSFVDQQPDWYKPVVDNAYGKWLFDVVKPVSDVVMANNPAAIPFTYVVGTVSTLLKNGMKYLQDTSDGKAPQWQGKLTAKGWEDTPDPMAMAMRGWDKQLRNGRAVFTGNVAEDQKLYRDVEAWLQQPGIGQTLARFVGEAAYDPTSYIPGALKIKGGIAPSRAYATSRLSNASDFAKGPSVIGSLDEAPELARLDDAMNRRATTPRTLQPRQVEVPRGLTPAEAQRVGIERPAPATVLQGQERGPALRPGQNKPLALPEANVGEGWNIARDRSSGSMYMQSPDGKYAVRANGGKFNLYEIADDAGKTAIKPRGSFDTLEQAQAAARPATLPTPRLVENVRSITPGELARLKKSGAVPQYVKLSDLTKKGDNILYVDNYGNVKTVPQEALALPPGSGITENIQAEGYTPSPITRTGPTVSTRNGLKPRQIGTTSPRATRAPTIDSAPTIGENTNMPPRATMRGTTVSPRDLGPGGAKVSRVEPAAESVRPVPESTSTPSLLTTANRPMHELATKEPWDMSLTEYQMVDAARERAALQAVDFKKVKQFMGTWSVEGVPGSYKTKALAVEKAQEYVRKAIDDVGSPSFNKQSEYTYITHVSGQLRHNPELVSPVARSDYRRLTGNAASTVSPADLRATAPSPRITRAATRSPSPATVNAPRSPERATVQDATEPTTRYSALDADDTATLTGKPAKPMEIGKPGQKSFDLQELLPEGAKERGFNRNIRTDANMPDKLRDSVSKDPWTYEQIHGKDTVAKAQAVFDTGFDKARAELVRLTDAAKPEAIPLAKMLAKQAMESGNVPLARELMSDVASKLTEAGQFTQAARLLRQSDPETVLMTLEKQLGKLNTDGAKVYGKKWKDFDLTPGEMDELGKINPGDEQAIENFMSKFHARVADQMPATALEKLTAWRHMAMLLNPKTHIRNIAGNALMAGLNRGSSRLSGLLQKVLPRDLRTAAPIVRREAKQLAAEFFTKHEKELLTGSNKYNEGIGLNMPDKRVFKANALEKTRKFNYDALQAEDKFFFKRAYIDRLASAMQARGIKSLDDIPSDVLKLATSEAEKAVFRDQNILASTISKWKQGKAGLGVDTIMPFTKTPINIARRGIDYSPLGAGLSIKKLFKPATAAEGIDALAKGVTGTVVMGLGYLLADAGILTGAAPKDKDLASYDKATGNAPFSVLGAVTYDWAQPAAIPLSVGVAIHEATKDDPQAMAKLRRAIESGDTETVNKLAGFFGAALLDGFKASVDTMFNMSVLQGIQDLIGDPQGITAGLAKLPANYINQNIPTAVGQLARAIDPTVRQTDHGRSTPGDYLKTQAATVLNKLPGASMLLPPKITPFGQDQKAIENPLLRTLQNLLNPGNVTTPQEIDPQVDAELRRLYNAGQAKQFPTTVDRTFKFMDRTVSLNDTEYAEYQRTVGQETITAFKDIINSGEYDQIPKKELNEKLKALAATRGTTVAALRGDTKVLTRIQEEYRAFLLAKGILYAKALGQLQVLRKRGTIGDLTDKQLADRMGISKEIAGRIN